MKRETYEISVRRGENDLPVEHDGHLGRLEPGPVVLKVRIFRDFPVYAFTVDGKKNVAEKHPFGPRSNPEGRRYRLTVDVKPDPEGINRAFYPHNNLRLLVLERNMPGKFSVVEVAVVSQEGEFFVTTQEVYEAWCFRDKDVIVCPRFDERWPQLVTFVSGLLGEEEEISSFLRPPMTIPVPPSANGIPPSMRGQPRLSRVLWWNQAQGLGAVTVHDGNGRPSGQARLLRRHVVWDAKKRGRLITLTAGEFVQYDSLEPVKDGNSSFKQEIHGVHHLGSGRF